MMKKVTVLTAGILCAAGIAIGASATGIIRKVQSEIRPDFTVKIDGEVRTFKNADGDVVYPMLYEGTTYLPLRAIGEIMGKTVYWYEDEKMVELKDTKPTVTDADVIVPSGDGQLQNTAEPDNSQSSASEITVEQAKKIALEKAGFAEKDVFFKEAKKDFDDGKWVYDIEFVKDKVEYSAEILVSDGTIVKWEVDRD
ncbi:MAG: hypothetical protein HFE49_02655 [Clostridia bacterium]|nr:hypothetical protein [Clostridia bacterium]